MTERHVELGGWKSVRHAPPERRVLMGETLIAAYHDADQPDEVADLNRENERRRILQQQYKDEFRAQNPDAKQVRLPREQKAESDWSQAGMVFRLRLDMTGVDCDLETALDLCNFREGERVVVCPRWAVDERPDAQRTEPFTPTPKQMLYGTRADIAGFELERNGAGHVTGGFVVLRMPGYSGSSNDPAGFLFGAFERPLRNGERYSLDPDPNDINGFWHAKITAGMRAIEAGTQPGGNALYDRLAHPGQAAVDWPADAAEAQARFLAGLDALHAAGALHDFEPGKRDYIGGHGDDAVLLVQGPPGTGKSYSTGFAVLARVQGALAARRPFRALLCCKTHSATDVLLRGVADAKRVLLKLRAAHPGIFDAHFDARLLGVPLFRIAPKGSPDEGIIPLKKDAAREKGEPRVVDDLIEPQWCVAAATPGGIYGAVKDKWGKALFEHPFCDLLVLDEASQMSLPEALMAALPLRAEAQAVVVGDPRQMPPIVKHDWGREARRTFQVYRSYQSLFEALLEHQQPQVKFEESFRLHAAMADFLCREIYRHDGIAFHSRRRDVLPDLAHADAFVAAVLSPEHPLVVVVHDEEESQSLNLFEQQLVAPVLRALSDDYALDARKGMGVVVPHRAQRAAFLQGVPELTVVDATTGAEVTAVDTVERYQGDERDVILVSATESNRSYLQDAAGFLLEPRRLTVALSRAKKKMVLVAAHSVFSFFTADEELFRNSQIWKALLRRTCTVLLWEGEREGHRVTVWGNQRSVECEVRSAE